MRRNLRETQTHHKKKRGENERGRGGGARETKKTQKKEKSRTQGIEKIRLGMNEKKKNQFFWSRGRGRGHVIWGEKKPQHDIKKLLEDDMIGKLKPFRTGEVGHVGREAGILRKTPFVRKGERETRKAL